MTQPHELAARIKRRSVIKDPTSDAFYASGNKAATILAGRIELHFGPDPELDILDFGCGSGRVLLPLARLLPRCRFSGNDVDAEAVSYLSCVAPTNCRAEANLYNPPLSYHKGSFDCIFAVSVWSHFPEDAALAWMREMKRLLKPGGLLLASVGGSATLKAWQKTCVQWKQITEEDMLREGYVYREFVNLNTSPELFPGIAGTGSWGNTLLHADYINRVWGPILQVLAIEEAAMPGGQDLVTLRRATGT